MSMNPMYAKQMIQMAEENKQSLNIRKEIILDDEMMDDKIDFLIELITGSEHIGSVKKAAELQHINL